MRTYRGTRAHEGGSVTVNGEPLPPRLDLRSHSPAGFDWGHGYGGGGPTQLALALLADALGDEQARQWYQTYKWAVVASLPAAGWTLTDAEVRQTVDRLAVRGTAPTRGRCSACSEPEAEDGAECRVSRSGHRVATTGAPVRP